MKPLRKDPRREEKEKKGGGAALGPAAGVGSGGAASPTSFVGSTATVGASSTSSPWVALARLVSRSAGLDSVLSTKAGLAAVLVAGSAAAVGVSLLIGGGLGERGRSSRLLGGSSPFSSATDSAERTSASLPAASGGPSSLDYFATANKETAEIEPAAATADQAAAPALPAAPAAPPLALPPEVKPMMKKGKGLPVGGAGALASKVELAKVQSLAGGRFQDVYKAASAAQSGAFAQAQKAPRYGANKRTAVLSSGNSALAQARFTNRLSSRGARTGSANSAAAYAAAAFDASNPSGRSTALGESGSGVRDLSSNSLGDTYSSESPPPPEAPEEKNKTPYQGLIYAALAAMMIGTMLVQVAGKLVSAAQADPLAAPTLLPMAQALAAAAAGAGGTAVALGAMVSDQYKQLTQGLPYIIGGAIVAAKAAEVLIKASAAGEEAESGVNEAAGSSASDALQALQGLSGLGQQQPQQEEKKPDPPEPIGDGMHQPQDTSFKGDINTLGE